MYFVIRAFVYSPVKKSAFKDNLKHPSRISVLDIKYTNDRFGNDVLQTDSAKDQLKNDSVREKKTALKIRKSSFKLINFARYLIDKYGEYTIWSLSAFQICYSCFSAPNHVTPSFFDSLIHVTASKKRLGSEASQIVQGFSKLNRYLGSLPDRHPIEVIPTSTSSKNHIMEWTKKGDAELIKVLKPVSLILEKLSPEIRHNRLLCSIQHPGTSSCLRGAIFTTRDVTQQLWKTYIVLNGASFLIAEVRSLFASSHDSSRPPLFERVWKTIITIIRNTFMVSSYVGVFSYFLCLLRNRYPGREYLLNYGIAGLLACPTIYIDKPGRLTELNSFVVSKVIESFIITLGLWKIIKYSRFFEMCFMVPTYGILSVIIEKYHYSLNGFTVPLLKWFYDVDPSSPQ